MPKRTDANQKAIVSALRKAGYSVQSIHTVGQGAPDVIVGGPIPCPHCGAAFPQNRLIEIKNNSLPPSRRYLTPDEQAWHKNWRGQVHIVESADDALSIISTGSRLGSKNV